MTTSAFQEEKLAKRFKWWDSNGDGLIDEGDFRLAARRLGEAFGHAPGSPAQAEAERECQRIWQQLASQAGVDRDGSIDESHFVNALGTVAGTHAGVDETYLPMVEAMLRLADSDGDGRLSIDEFARFLVAVIAVPQADATEVARRLDSDGDGHVTLQQIMDSAKEFYLSDNSEGANHRLHAML